MSARPNVAVVRNAIAKNAPALEESSEISTDSLQLFLKDVDKARTIRMPVHIVEKLNKIVRTERKLRAELGRDPYAWEIGDELELDAAEVESIRRSSQPPVSLEKPVGDEEDSEFGDFLTDENQELPDEAAEATLREEALRKILGT